MNYPLIIIGIIIAILGHPIIGGVFILAAFAKKKPLS